MLKPETVIIISMIYVVCGQFDEGVQSLVDPFRRFKINAFTELKASIESNDNSILLRRRRKLQPTISKNVPFPCSTKNARSSKRPTSVHRLRLGDIDVVAGIGDSLTAGVGLTATNTLQVAFENRGMGPTAGGEETWREYYTLPNFLKEFNSNLVGYATQGSLTLHKESVFNMGETGALSEDTPYMAKLLIKRMKSHVQVDMENHWKIISYVIGPNNFCTEICFRDNMTKVLEDHKLDVLAVLRTLKKHSPRTIVNMIPTPHLKILTELTGKNAICGINHILECPCLFGPMENNRPIYFDLMKKWQQFDKEVATYDEFDSDNFTVVSQPFTIDFFIPKRSSGLSDFSYLSEDCFHMSQKGNARIALSLWKNLLEPVGKKSTSPIKISSKIKCPKDDHPFIYTRRNSK